MKSFQFMANSIGILCIMFVIYLLIIIIKKSCIFYRQYLVYLPHIAPCLEQIIAALSSERESCFTRDGHCTPHSLIMVKIILFTRLTLRFACQPSLAQKSVTFRWRHSLSFQFQFFYRTSTFFLKNKPKSLQICTIS